MEKRFIFLYIFVLLLLVPILWISVLLSPKYGTNEELNDLLPALSEDKTWKKDNYNFFVLQIYEHVKLYIQMASVCAFMQCGNMFMPFFAFDEQCEYKN